MPGLFGVIDAIGVLPDLGPKFDLMGQSMMHDRSYRTERVSFPKSGIWIGWTGHAGSFSDCMPVWNETREIALMFTGENFADPDQIDRLRRAGHDFTDDDASYLVHLYEEQGEAFVERLNGTFAGVVVDRRCGRACLFNDRHGLSRIYYFQASDALWFASEAKALLRVHPELRQFDPQSMAEFFGCGCALQGRSLFKDVALLPPASLWSWACDQPARRSTYFSVHSWEEQPSLPPREYSRQFAEMLAAIIPRYFAGRQPVAVSVTGGLDSRLVAAWGPRRPFLTPCYTFSGMYHKCRDAILAERVSREWQQHHYTLVLDKAFLNAFPALAKRAVFLTDGAHDVSSAVSLYVNRLARDIAPIRLTGNYGDEVMRDNTTLKPDWPRLDGLTPDFAHAVGAVSAELASEMVSPRLSFILRKQVPWQHFGRLSAEQTQLTVRTPFLDNALVQLQFRCPPAFQRSIDFALSMIAAGDPAFVRFPTDRGHLCQRRRIWNRPREWLDMVFTRADYLYDYGMPQFCVGRCERIGKWNVDRHFLGRHKYYHFRTWYRNELAAYLRETLLDTRTLGRAYLDRKALERLVTAHTTGKGNFTVEIHKLLTFELAHRQFVDAPQWS